MKELSSYIDTLQSNRVEEGFYKNTNTHNYTLLKKAVEQLNELNTDWKHEVIPVKRGVEKILKSIEPIIGDFVIVQRCIKGYNSHTIVFQPDIYNWCVGILREDCTCDIKFYIDDGASKYVGSRIECEIETGVVEEFELGVIKNDKIEII